MWFGADPGGKASYGLAWLSPDGSFRTTVVSCTDEALSLVTQCPLGVGIDSPMWWSSGKSGDRRADQFLRGTYKIASGTVQTANSLRGAALIQGHLLAVGLRQRFPGVRITEAHPKALLLALRLADWDSIVRRFALRGDLPLEEHARDALLSAVAAREAGEGRWTRNLATNRIAGEQDPAQLAFGPVDYFWPD